MIVAVIPARGGSQRIPKKNVRVFCGQPIIRYSIEAALKSCLFDRVIVSTDCGDIAKIARDCGAEVPFVRPAELSGNFVSTGPVLKHAIQELNQDGDSIEYACAIYPTAPFVQKDHLEAGLNLLRASQANVVIPVTTFDFPIYRAVGVTDEGEMKLLWPEILKTWDEHEITRSNDLPEAYHDAGQFYWLRAGPFMTDAKLWGPRTRPLIIPRKFVVDIDTTEDWEVAELKMRAMKLGGVE